MTKPATTNITLNIGGRSHVIATTPDETPHLRKLAAMVDDRLRALGIANNQTETRMLLIGALVLADELHALQSNGPVAEPAPIDAATLMRVTALADRVEKLALRLEQFEATH